MNFNNYLFKFPVFLYFLILIITLISLAGVHAQSVELIYSPCLHCPGCFSDCPQVPPDSGSLSCPVCQEGAGKIGIPRTGQTKCYNTNGNIIDCAGTGQDGYIQTGVVWPSPRSQPAWLEVSALNRLSCSLIFESLQSLYATV